MPLPTFMAALFQVCWPCRRHALLALVCALSPSVAAEVLNAGDLPRETTVPYVSPTNGLGSWIWAAKTLDNQTCQLWRAFEVPPNTTVAEARLVLTADNEFTLYLDGQQLGRGAEWRELFVFDVTDLLPPGRHVVAVRCYNGSFYAGMIFGLHANLANGGAVDVKSDESWRIVPNETKGWEKQAEAAADWPTATVIAGLADGPWWKQPEYVNRMPLPQMFKIHFWQTGWFQITTLAVGCAGILVVFRLTAQLAMHRRERRLLQQERARIAREIHDDIGARMTQLVLEGEEAQGELDVGPAMRKRLSSICQEARGLLSTMDEILWAVNPRRDTLRDFATYVCKYAQKFLKPTRIQCLLDVEPEISTAAFDLPLRRSLFMAIKEALHNAVKHSDATELLLKIEWRRDRLVVVVKDNGKGFAPPTAALERNGLGNMVQRMTQVGGGCEIASAPGQGCRVEFSIPLKQRRRWYWGRGGTGAAGQTAGNPEAQTRDLNQAHDPTKL